MVDVEIARAHAALGFMAKNSGHKTKKIVLTVAEDVSRLAKARMSLEEVSTKDDD